MSGHSKWAKIKRAKEVTDAKKGQVFTRLSNQIAFAASEGGDDPGTNFTLRLLMDKARSANMPSASIQKAIDRGSGKSKEAMDISQISYEGYGPGGVAVIVDCVTDNTNRTVSNIRSLFEKAGGSLGEANSVAWQFEEVGLITIRSSKTKKSNKFGKEDEIENIDPEELELELFEIEGIDNIVPSEIEDDDGNVFKGFEVYTQRDALDKVRTVILDMGIMIESAELIKQANQKVEVDKGVEKKILDFIEELGNDDDVDNVWFNADID